MKRIGLMSDTHGFLDEGVFRYFADCDEVWHAGDFGTLDLIRKLEAFKPLRGVYGNIDGADVQGAMPLDSRFEVEGLSVYMTHIGGYPGQYDKRARKNLEADPPGLFLCGHSHVLKVMRDAKLGLLHMNPGACGNQGWHTMKTLLRFTVEAGKVSGVEAVELGPRGRGR
ncbi:MAG: metallophosphoesterase family protein [Bryobacteraceae bacterium]